MYEQNLNERDSPLNWAIIWAVAGLMVIGTAFIYSATMANNITSGLPWYQQSFFKQMVWYAVGIGVATLVCLVDYQSLARWSLVFYWVNILFLVLVLIIGTKIFGARRWINLGFFQFQPSEFAKLGFILAQAHFLSRSLDELRSARSFLKTLGLTVLPFLLILKEPDLGSALVLFPVGLVMMFVAGIPAKYLARFLIGVGILISLLLVDILFAPPTWQIKLEDYQRHRLLVYFGKDFARPDASPADRQRARDLQNKKSYNVKQALISVGSGGLAGKGWRRGTQNSLGYLPRAVAHNDFIFSVIAEEKGFIGSLAVLILYGIVLFSALRIAGQARDRLGRLLAVGIVALIFSHVFINIGMNIRLMPVTGIPLPLVSYGGSSVLCFLIATGLLQNIQIHRKNY